MEDDGFVDCDSDYLSNYNSLETWNPGSYPNMSPTTRLNYKKTTGFHFVHVHDLDNIADPDTLDGFYDPYENLTEEEWAELEGTLDCDDESETFYEDEEVAKDYSEDVYSQFMPDDLEDFVFRNDLDIINFTNSFIVNKVTGMVSAALSLQNSLLREIALKILTDVKPLLDYVQKNRYRLNGSIPGNLRHTQLKPFPEYFRGYSYSLRKVSQKELNTILFKIYKPICQLVKKRYFPKDRFILQLN